MTKTDWYWMCDCYLDIHNHVVQLWNQLANGVLERFETTAIEVLACCKSYLMVDSGQSLDQNALRNADSNKQAQVSIGNKDYTGN